MVPVFPLPGIFLFPQQILPLHIFEPRYRQMIEDSLDGPGQIVLATLPEDPKAELGASPPFLSIAGLGEIVRHQRLADGRFLIWLAGLARVQVEEAASDRLYRKVAYKVLEEIPATPGQANALREPLAEAILARRKEFLNIAEDVPTGMLADILLQLLVLPQAEMERIFAELRCAPRAELALEAHRRYPEQPAALEEN